MFIYIYTEISETWKLNEKIILFQSIQFWVNNLSGILSELQTF